MGAETEKPVWERIAEMGFADAVESKGFKRVNATHWKMESEGLTWRVRLVQGYKATPTSFLPVHGALVHGLDELCARWDGSKASEYLHGGGQRVHMQSDTGTDVRQATWRQREQFPGPFEIPYLGQAGPRTRERAFLTKGHDLGELSGFVTDLWEAYSWKWIESRLSFRELYRLHWGPGTHSPTTVTPWYFGAAALADDLAFIGETLVDLHSLASEWADKAQEEGIDLASLEVGSPRSEHRAHVTDNLLQAYARAKLARAILRALQIDVTPPHMDFSAFDQYVKRNYGPSAPFLRY